jgi:hypothetical protein
MKHRLCLAALAFAALALSAPPAPAQDGRCWFVVARGIDQFEIVTDLVQARASVGSFAGPFFSLTPRPGQRPVGELSATEALTDPATLSPWRSAWLRANGFPVP